MLPIKKRDVVPLRKRFRLFEHMQVKQYSPPKKGLPDCERRIFLTSHDLLPQFPLTIRALDSSDEAEEQKHREQPSYRLQIASTYNDLCEHGITSNPWKYGQLDWQPTFPSSTFFDVLRRLRFQVGFTHSDVAFEGKPFPPGLADGGELCFYQFSPIPGSTPPVATEMWAQSNVGLLHVCADRANLHQIWGMVTLADSVSSD